MFALGCILYEVTTGHKLFPDDWNIREYALKGESIFPASWPSCVPGSRLYSLGELAQSLLDIDPFKRPSALRTGEVLELIRQGRIPELRKLDGRQVHVTQIRPPSPPRIVNVAQVHYRRSAPSFQAAPYSSQEIGARRPAQRTNANAPKRALSAYMFSAMVCCNCPFTSFPLKSPLAELVSM
jgi:serine/threonine protein kinase